MGQGSERAVAGATLRSPLLYTGAANRCDLHLLERRRVSCHSRTMHTLAPGLSTPLVMLTGPRFTTSSSCLEYKKQR